MPRNISVANTRAGDSFSDKVARWSKTLTLDFGINSEFSERKGFGAVEVAHGRVEGNHLPLLLL